MSRLEAGHCNYLHLLKRAGKITSIETQKRFALTVAGETICSHYADFFVEWADGKKEVIESKGMETDLWRIKYRLMVALYPEIDYRIWKHPINGV